MYTYQLGTVLTHAQEEHETSRAQLIRTMCALGYPRAFSEVVAQELRTSWACSRMQSYIAQARPNSLEEIADELVAIVDARERFRNKAISEKANAAYTRWLNSDERESE